MVLSFLSKLDLHKVIELIIMRTGLFKLLFKLYILDRVLEKPKLQAVFNGKMWPLNSKPFEWLCVSTLLCAAVWLTGLNHSHLPVSVFQHLEQVLLQSKFFLSLL